MSQDLLGLTDKTVIVWGGGFGMGESTARLLAQAGAKVAVVDLERERAEQVAAALKADGSEAIALQADATDSASVDRAVAATEAALGPIDKMATVIGIGVWSLLADMTDEQWHDSLRLNLTSFFVPARAVARSMIKGKRPGAIACVSSVSGATSSPNNGGYGAAKAGMINLIRTMAVEWGPHGIRVNAAMPGSVHTPRVNPSGEALERINTRMPLGRIGSTDDIARGLVFLLSDLSRYTTGHNLAVDGGWMSTFAMHDGIKNMVSADAGVRA